MAGGAANKMDSAVCFPSVMCIYGEDGGEFAGLGQAGQVEAVGEAGEAPGVAVSVEPYIIV